MSRRRPPRAAKRRQQGYVLLMVVFMATSLLILAMMIAPRILTEGRREQETEMIWRGKQYVRGVKLYYRKMGRFPTSLDDLTKPKIGSIRFMRQAYRDPMNSKDGSWRLIYVGPAGQLIGSLKPPQQNLQFGQAPGVGTPVSSLASPGNASGSGSFGSFLQSTGLAQQIQSSTQPGGTPPGTNPPNTTGPPVSADQGTDPNATPQLPPNGEFANIVGGNIIGVGSKIDKKSVIVYDKAKNYLLYEFIWDPSKDIVAVGQPGTQIGTPTGPGMGGQTSPQVPFGQQPGQNPVNPPQNPQQPQQNPQQQ
jgi:hypothetical protein